MSNKWEFQEVSIPFQVPSHLIVAMRDAIKREEKRIQEELSRCLFGPVAKEIPKVPHFMSAERIEALNKTVRIKT